MFPFFAALFLGGILAKDAILEASRHKNNRFERQITGEMAKLPQNLLTQLENNGKANWIIEINVVDDSTSANELWDELVNLNILDKNKRQNKICEISRSSYHPLQKNLLEFLEKEEKKPGQDFMYDVIFEYIFVRHGNLELAKGLIKFPEVSQLLTKSEDENSQL